MEINYKIGDDYLQKLVNEILLHPEFIDKDVAYNISSVLSENFYADKRVIELIVNNNNLQSLLVKPKMIVNIIELIKEYEDILYNEDSSVEFLLKINNKLFDSSTSEPIINKICSILSNEISQPYDSRDSIKEKKAKFCYNLLSKIIIARNNRERVPINSLNLILDVLITKYANINWNQKYFLLPILYKIKEIDDKDSILKIDQNILSFVSSSDFVGFERFYKFNKSHEALTTTEDIKNSLLNRAISNINFLELIYTNSNENLQTEILLRTLAENKQLFIIFLDKIGFKVKNRIEIANNIVEESKKNIPPQIKHNLYLILDKINPSKEEFEYNDYITHLMNNYISQNAELQQHTTSYLNDTKFVSTEQKQHIISLSLSTFISNPKVNFSIITNIINEINFEIEDVLDGFYNTYKDVYDKFFFEQRNLGFIKLFIKRVSYSCNVEIIKTLFKNIEEHISKDINSDLTFSPFLNEMIELIDQNLFKEIKDILNRLIVHYLEIERNPEVLKTGIKYIEKYKLLNRDKIPKDFKEKLQSLYHRRIDVNTIELLKQHIIDSSIQINLHNQPIEAGHFDDDIYNGEIFDLRKYFYEFTLKLDSPIEYWRLGFVFSPDGSFNAKSQRTIINFPLIHLTKNEGNKLALTFYSNGINKSMPEDLLIDKYKKQEVIITINKNETNARISFFDKSMKSLHSDIEIPNYHYFKLFAWADAKNDFDIDVIIHKKVV